MKFLSGLLLIVILWIAYVLDNQAHAKTVIEAKVMDKQSFSLVAIKEIKPEGELGVIFVCHKDEDEIRVIPMQPVVGESVPAINKVTFVKYDQRGDENRLFSPFSTYDDHIWNLGVAVGVMQDPSYKGTYAVRLYYVDGGYTETRKFTDVEFKRITKNIRFKGCRNDHAQAPSDWEHAGSVDFSTYNKYN